MKQEKISVIVPCYNVEKYVSKCLDSLINQTYKNLEIICVEDCATDNTYNILKEYVKKDSRIKLIKNKKNGGLSYSRNEGIKNATGSYLSFIDSDDYVDNNFYEVLYKSLKKNKADISICDMKVVYEDTKQESISKCCNYEEFNVVNVVNNGLAASACNKLFKKELFNDYLFEVGKVNEDIAVVIPALVHAKSIAYAPNVYYYYVQRGGSIQNSGFSDKRFDIFYGVDTTLDRIKGCKNYEDIKDALIYNQIIVVLIYIIPKIKDRKRRKEVLKKYNELSSKYNIRQNRYFGHFLLNCGKKHRIYYKTLFKTTCEKHYIVVNNLISTYNILHKLLKKPVISKNIDINIVIEAAKKQSVMKDENIKVSVVVPNYNYARFMNQRIYSILNQNYKLHELIILDDKSKDNSIEEINKIVNKIKKYVNVKTIYNEKNSGSAFKQWKKGFEEATGDYIWIAEADDYCEPNLIKNLVKPIKNNKNIMISYSDTAFIDTVGNITMKSINNEIDIQRTNHWKYNYVNNGLDEINNYSFLINSIANVSSCIIKKGDYSKFLSAAGKYKQAGDWLLYVEIMALGDIAYTSKALNYYRLHGNNVSATMKHQKHLDELNKLYEYYIERFNLNKDHKKKIKERIKFLKEAWNLK